MIEPGKTSLEVDCVYGYNSIIGEISAEVRKGEFVSVTGPNGVGKSTLISTIAGELEPIEGTVRVVCEGEDSLVDPSSPQGTGCVTSISNPAFLPDLTLGEHINLVSLRTGVEMDTLLSRLEPWRVAELPNTLPSRLSSGQKQRANLGIQLAVAAPVVVLDEPERHLDADWTRLLCAQLRQMAQSGFTVIVASHSPSLIDEADWEIRL
ncbi:ATP-binding cassette domain-containing protein [Corynebacterium amycolatum]|uniref:ABC transporter ATP-binding protein n=1 Tax=Corynebacterium amycolatum TaxID=43765 RepID=UPI002119E7B8|nr:ATP-binding cassette domain-containing protein [Corynebacterium amycolatum]MCQ9127060.1 ATP-binding cassette domain-containing protein [Corynebacterium amycolatum]MCQ9140844.1 ATP-binding cassette domain-containing protein [Corynebacterium amycolatum]MCQ9169707.1 ATP-binding cassette domain-containing protein [Corynebacterium amycolatum]MCQ9175618.1 ATP-binding cassette domain-containing protein [Corynebacterium amycolatum]